MKYLIIAFSLLIFSSCKQSQNYVPKNLTKVSEATLIENYRNKIFPNSEKIIYKDTIGNLVSWETIDFIPATDYYQNSNEEIIEAIVRKTTQKDLDLEKKMSAAFLEGPVVKPVEINCENKNKILNEVFVRDQGMREEGAAGIDLRIDHENLEIITSFINKCGIPTLEEVSEEAMAAIWLVLQHALPRHQKKYIPQLEVAAKRGDIKWGTIALMKDRALMHEGKPQIYGTQTRNGKLWELHEPQYVNQRRSENGMGPIQEHLRKHGIEFTIAQKEK